MQDILESLSKELAKFCARYRLPQMSADELIYRDLPDAQLTYLMDFIARWETVVAAGEQLRAA